MKHNIKFYIKLFTSTFMLSAFTFGGGYVICPLMKKQFVEKLGWINEKEMLDFIAIAQSSPGAMAVNASVLLGYHLSGILGALVAIVGTVLPPLVLISVISVGYSMFASNELIKNVLRGLQAGVCAIIIDVVIGMGYVIIKDRKVIPIILMLFAFIAVTIFNVNVILVIFICGLAGFISVIKKSGKEGKYDIS
ncbi:MAG: chromate transporter [Eubacteriales bacterium]